MKSPKHAALRRVVAVLMKTDRDAESIDTGVRGPRRDGEPSAVAMIRALLDRCMPHRQIRRATRSERIADRHTVLQSRSLGPRLRVRGSR
jgi:hypothetical protein